MAKQPQLQLASTSPRRREILAALGLQFVVTSVDVDETPRPGEGAHEMVLRLAEDKATAADAAPGAVVVAADTAVVVDDVSLGKPVDCDHCLEMLAALAGRSHKVLTGVAVRTRKETRTALSETAVHFRDIGRDLSLIHI